VRRLGPTGKDAPLTEKQARILLDALEAHERRLAEVERKLNYVIELILEEEEDGA
jgi:hypothetical protein